MLYNKNENSLTAENTAVQAALVHATDTGDTERKSITVSKETFAYLKCLQQIDTLWSCMREALELYYGWETSDRIMDEEYSGKNDALRCVIEKYLCISIGDNVNCRDGFTEI